MNLVRCSFPALLVAVALPAWAQIASSPSTIPNGLTPGLPSSPNIGPSYNTAPVGSVGIGGTTTQITPNSANPTGGTSLSSSGSSGIGYSSSGVGGASSVTSSNIPGYTPPGSSALPGYSSPPGTLTFPSTSGTSTMGVPPVNGSLGGTGSSLNGNLGGSSGTSGIGSTTSGTGLSGGAR